MSDIALVYLILAAAVVLFVSGRVPVGIVAIGVALALWATGILSLTAALSGFGDPTVLFIASLFVVSRGPGRDGGHGVGGRPARGAGRRPGGPGSCS